MLFKLGIRERVNNSRKFVIPAKAGIQPSKLLKTAVILFCVGFLFSGLTPKVFAASSGPNSPGTMADDNAVGSRTWDSPNNTNTSDNVYASYSSNAGAIFIYSH